METKLESLLMTAYKDEMISFVHANPDSFIEVITLAMADKYPYSWRSAWLLFNSMQDNDERLKPFVSEIIACLESKADGHQRELLKVLLKMEIDDEQEGYLFDTCVTIWEKINIRPGTRYTAMRFILQVVKKYPDLQSEVDFLTQEHYMESLSPGIKHSLIQMLKEI